MATAKSATLMPAGISPSISKSSLPKRYLPVLSSLKGRLKNVEHEGFMVFDAQNGEMLFKLKSPYYLISKFHDKFL